MAAVLLLAGEGPIQRAIDLETGGGDELFTRTTQRTGGAMAAILVGAAMGVVFAIVLAAIRRRSPHVSSRKAAAWLGAAAFAALNLAPALKYPPNPPGIGSSETVARRTILYLVMLAWSLLVAWAGWRSWRWRKNGLATAALVVGLLGVAMLVLPAGPSDEALPSDLVWQLRIASMAGWAAFWAVAATALAVLQKDGGVGSELAVDRGPGSAHGGRLLGRRR